MRDVNRRLKGRKLEGHKYRGRELDGPRTGPRGRDSLVRTVSILGAALTLVAMTMATAGAAGATESPDLSPTTSTSTTSTPPGSTSTTSTPSGTAPATETAIEPAVDVAATEGVSTTTGGRLVWGVRKAFVSYIKGPIAKGTITVSGGAVDNTAVDGTFSFPGLAGGSFDGATNDTSAAFAGSVRFTGHDYGHGPELDLLLENLRILRDGTGSWLVSDVTSVPFHGTGSGGGAPDAAVLYPNLKVAALATAGTLPVAAPPDGLTWFDLAATLTAEAVPAFGFYAAGEKMDPVTYTLTFDEVPDVPLDPVGPVAPVVSLDKSVVAAGELLTATGPRFLAGEQVEVWIHSTPVWVTTAVADPDGTATITFTVPLDTVAGVHQIEMRGISSEASIWSTDFTVTPAPVGSTATGTLPQTGADGGIAAVGAGLVGVGVALVLVSRRRRRLSPA